MKKIGQSHKKIKPENGILRNLDHASYGRFMDRPVMAASDAIQMVIRTPKPSWSNIKCGGTAEYEDGSVYHYECDECPKNEGCSERYERAKADEDALTKFFKKNPAEMEAQEVADIRDVARIFCNAWKDRDSGFFEEMAALMGAFLEKEEVVKRISICDRTIPNTSPAYTAVLGEYIARTVGQGDKEIGSEELLQAANDRCSDKVEGRTYRRIRKSCGINVTPEKPGPKPERKKTAGKGRE